MWTPAIVAVLFTTAFLTALALASTLVSNRAKFKSEFAKRCVDLAVLLFGPIETIVLLAAALFWIFR